MELVSICVKISRTIWAEKLSGAAVTTSQRWFPLFANYANTALRHSLFLHRCFKKFAAYFLPVLHRAYVSHVGSRVRSLRSKNRDFIIIGIEVFFSRLIMTRCTFLWLVNSSRRRIHWQGSVYHCLPFPNKYGSFDRHRLKLLHCRKTRVYDDQKKKLAASNNLMPSIMLFPNMESSVAVVWMTRTIVSYG